MNRHSIFTKINVFFVIFVVLLVAMFAGIYIVHKFKAGGDTMRHVHQYMHSVHRGDGADASMFELRLLSEAELAQIKTKTPVREFGRPDARPSREVDKTDDDRPPRRESIYEDGGKRYIVAHGRDGDVGFEDKSNQLLFYILFWGIFVVSLGSVTWLYRMIINSLKPIGTLEAEIRNFGTSIRRPEFVAGEPRGEIDAIRQAFYDSSSKIATLMSAREMFLKNVAHELKTPIAKGLVVAHLIDEEKQKTRLIEIFTRLNQIVESVRATEELSMEGFKASMRDVNLKRLCTDTMRRALLGDESVMLLIDETAAVCADERLLAIALSNLFENGVKFSDDSRVMCGFEDGKIFVKNLGEPLGEALERYEEPFYKETSIRNSDGMGLGLYLTKKALEMQGLCLCYEHKDGFNIFAIKKSAV